MAGHSRWAQIKRKKAVTDSRRGKLWTKLLKEIAVSARLGGGDPEGNPRLRAAILEARAANMPNDNIERAIQRGTGQLAGTAYEELTYEGYAPGGVAVLIEALTDNRNRTVGELRHLFSRYGGNLGENGCVAWMFSKRGCVAVPRSAIGEERLVELALEAGAEDVDLVGDVFEIYTAPEELAAVAAGLAERGVAVESKSLAMVPTSAVEPRGGEAQRALRLLEAIEDHDDVQHVWSNLEVPADLMAAAEAS